MRFGSYDTLKLHRINALNMEQDMFLMKTITFGGYYPCNLSAGFLKLY